MTFKIRKSFSFSLYIQLYIQAFLCRVIPSSHSFSLSLPLSLSSCLFLASLFPLSLSFSCFRLLIYRHIIIYIVSLSFTGIYHFFKKHINRSSRKEKEEETQFHIIIRFVIQWRLHRYSIFVLQFLHFSFSLINVLSIQKVGYSTMIAQDSFFFLVFDHENNFSSSNPMSFLFLFIRIYVEQTLIHWWYSRPLSDVHISMYMCHKMHSEGRRRYCGSRAKCAQRERKWDQVGDMRPISYWLEQ